MDPPNYGINPTPVQPNSNTGGSDYSYTKDLTPDEQSLYARGTGKGGWANDIIYSGLGEPIYLDVGTPGDNKIQPAKIVGIKETMKAKDVTRVTQYFDKHPAAQGKFDAWKNAIRKGANPIDAAKDKSIVGDSDLEQLRGTGLGGSLVQWQFRLDGYMRCSFTYDKDKNEVRIIGMGHT